MDLLEKLAGYVREFNENDEPLACGDIDNEHALAFLAAQIPLIELPDPVIERAYYFRWWTYRKHIRTTPVGRVVTEFLPPVPWAGPFNTINCPAGFHLREGRWLRDPDGILPEYIDFWLNGHGVEKYSSWLIAAVREYCDIRGDDGFTAARLDKMETMLRFHRDRAATESPLYRSVDNLDGMEYSISGSGLRPTVNSYLYGEADALASMYRRAGREADAARWDAFAAALRENILTLLWDGSFFKTIPDGEIPKTKDRRPNVPASHDARELVGYVPWYFGIPDASYGAAFSALTDPAAFAAPAGLSCAERSHPRYMEKHEHECLWNGPVWPFATSQTLVALARALREGKTDALGREDYTALLRRYAACHRRTLPDRRVVDWIDENLDPDTGVWLARSILESWGWRANKGGRERGKDYNHSLFCDLVLSGLLGIGANETGALCVSPLVPADWKHFRVENLTFRSQTYSVTYENGAVRVERTEWKA